MEEGEPPAVAALSSMKLSDLRKRAAQAGVDADALREACDLDEKDIKAAVVALIAAKETPSGPNLGALREELGGLKLSVLVARAQEAGADGTRLEEAYDSKNIKEAVIQLILELATAAAPKADAVEARLTKLREELGGLKLGALMGALRPSTRSARTRWNRRTIPRTSRRQSSS